MDAERRRLSSRIGGAVTRDRVMDVAEVHLLKVGYMGVSLEEVASEVGVSKAALYYHFPAGKEQLFVRIGHRSLARVREGLERAMAGTADGAGSCGRSPDS
jgi:AcrR family transcriptional regulator